MMSRSSSPGIYYGWWVLAGCFLSCFSYGVFYTLGIFFKPLQAEFNWNSTLVSSIHSVHLAIFIISTLLVGWSTDRLGPRTTLIWGGALVGIGIALCSHVDTIGQFYLFYGIASLGAGIVWTLPATTIQRWFVKRRGLTLGITAAGVGTGTLIYAPVANFLLLSYGWRTSYIIIGLATWAILMIAAALMVHSPERKGLKPYGNDELLKEKDTAAKPITKESKVWQSQEWTLREALKTRTFLILAATYFCTVLPIHMVMVHIIPFAITIGIDKTIAAAALGLIGGISIAGRITMSTAAEKLGWRLTLIICCGMLAVVFFWLLGVNNFWMLYVFVAVYGFFYGGKVPLLPGLIGFYFSGKDLATIIGIIHAVSVIGGALGPLIGGIIFDMTGSYNIAFIIGATLWIVAALLAYTLKTPKKTATPVREINAPASTN